ncbi:PIG-L family deacetylase [Capnocytophaga sp. Marseille-Q4570]|jgi:N-acetylglucosaminylphosphatidylinositol deacetylase family protein|uniref:PIG-L family deacetylase n=1 Tax=Capnocytophaga bilenii TaxID=2819369 RepID=A0ABS3PXQ4_9FLAO|nr:MULTISPECIES: PIG-L family deacetylase [Capnocytophaga]EKY07763.1 N-acetylglucosaminylphosphatidylinositol deacetylase [Capnocytophaga sp. oral taxon 332 str. F0381]MBO1883907.1 PIG-L family deacetylase [Capnocytophaga bilenii]
MKKVIVISAHPDDEILGAGGTLLKHKKNGDKIYWLIVTNVLESCGFSKERVCSRQKEIEKISEALGVEKVFLLNYPTMSLSTSTLIEMVPKISKVFTEIEPEIVYCLNRSDAHSDHRITFDAVMACTKSFRYPFIKQVLMYECISETEFAPQLPEKVFIPNYFVDISSFLEEKLELMKIYESEVGEHPFPRSLRNIEALATYRGASVGVEYAEAFQLIKYIDK